MSEPEHTTEWATKALRYLDALDAGDAAALAELWERAAEDPQLEQVLGDLTDGLADLEGPSPSWEIDAERVRDLLREHLPSAFHEEHAPPPLTVRDVAARLQTDSALGTRFQDTDRTANARLLADTTPLPEELGLPHFEKWRTSLGVNASAHYWRSFRQAAVLLAMGRCQQAGELAAARRAGRSAKGGRS
jgi:hypothetical protein